MEDLRIIFICLAFLMLAGVVCLMGICKAILSLINHFKHLINLLEDKKDGSSPTVSSNS